MAFQPLYWRCICALLGNLLLNVCLLSFIRPISAGAEGSRLTRQIGSACNLNDVNNAVSLSSLPAGLWYYNISHPSTNGLCKEEPNAGHSLCGVIGARVCEKSKQAACADPATKPLHSRADLVLQKTQMCKAARVFAVTLGSDCNLIVDCEYVDASRLSTRILVENSYYSKPPTDSPSAQPEANLLPKAGDVVLTSAYAVGIVKYVCSQGSQSPSNVSSAADLYSNDPTYNRVGTYLSTNESQYFLFNSSGPFATSTFNATATINSTRATGKVYPSSDLDGPYYGSLDQSYSTATGTLGLASVRYITTTSTYGGLLPPYTTCAKLPIPGVVQAPFSVPFQANFTFFSAYTPPI